MHAEQKNLDTKHENLDVKPKNLNINQKHLDANKEVLDATLGILDVKQEDLITKPVDLDIKVENSDFRPDYSDTDTASATEGDPDSEFSADDGTIETQTKPYCMIRQVSQVKTVTPDNRYSLMVKLNDLWKTQTCVICGINEGQSAEMRKLWNCCEKTEHCYNIEKVVGFELKPHSTDTVCTLCIDRCNRILRKSTQIKENLLLYTNKFICEMIPNKRYIYTNWNTGKLFCSSDGTVLCVYGGLKTDPESVKTQVPCADSKQSSRVRINGFLDPGEKVFF